MAIYLLSINKYKGLLSPCENLRLNIEVSTLQNELREVIKELKRVETGQSVDDDLLDVIRQINTTLYGMKEDSE